MISDFFIERPVLANVLAILMMVIGAVALLALPVAQYPDVVPPTVQVTTRYPGASARTVVDAVALPIAAGVFEPAFGLVLRPEIAALSMSGSSLLVAVNALMLKRLRLPEPPAEPDTVPATSPARPKRPSCWASAMLSRMEFAMSESAGTMSRIFRHWTMAPLKSLFSNAAVPASASAFTFLGSIASAFAMRRSGSPCSRRPWAMASASA